VQRGVWLRLVARRWRRHGRAPRVLGPPGRLQEAP
jgi:hypothetical protein